MSHADEFCGCHTRELLTKYCLGECFPALACCCMHRLDGPLHDCYYKRKQTVQVCHGIGSVCVLFASQERQNTIKFFAELSCRRWLSVFWREDICLAFEDSSPAVDSWPYFFLGYAHCPFSLSKFRTTWKRFPIFPDLRSTPRVRVSESDIG